MNIFSVQSLAKAHGIKVLFSDATLGIDAGDRVGIIGVNGSGKSTLLKCIAGLEPVDSGTIAMRQGLRMQYLPQAPEFVETMTVLDYVFASERDMAGAVRDYEACVAELEHAEATHDDAQHEALMERFSALSERMDAAGAWDYEARARIVLSRLGIEDFEAQLGTLSGGYRRRVALAHALLAEADLLLLDEPTNHLDAATISWLEGYLSRYPGAVMLVTHDRYFLDRVTKRLFEIQRGTLQEYPGNFTRYLELKAEEDERAQASDTRRRNILRGEIAWLKRGAKARSTKQKARIDRAEELKAVEGPPQREHLQFATQTRRLGHQVLEFIKVQKSLGGRLLIRDFSHVFKRGERLGIIGPNGCGKTTLMRMMSGELTPDGGKIIKGETVAFAIYEQETDKMDLAQKALDYVRLEGGEQLRSADGKYLQAALVMERFLFTPQMLHQPIGKLSGGERRRLYLVATLMRDPNFLILDEPTNDLDIMTLEALEDFLDSFSGCLMIISHDRYFLDRTVTTLYNFEGEGRLRLYMGGYTDFELTREGEEEERAEVENAAKQKAQRAASEAAKRGAGPASAAAANIAVATPAAAPNPDAQRKLSFNEKRELDKLEKEIPAMEERVLALDEEIAAAYADHVKLRKLTQEQSDLRTRIKQTTERWELLASRPS